MPAPAPHSLKVTAAYFSLLGYSMDDIGAEVRRTRRTIYTWTREEGWSTCLAEAEALYLKEVIAVSRKAVLNQVKAGDGDLGFKILERSVKGLEPVKSSERNDESRQPVEIIIKHEQQDYHAHGANGTSEAAGHPHVNGETQSHPSG